MSKTSANIGLRGADGFKSLLQNYRRASQANIVGFLGQVGLKWHAEAARRIPVDLGRARNSIRDEVSVDGDVVTLVVGTNLADPPYPIWLEFGTRRIAGGAVLDIGDKPEVTDSEAVHEWQALIERGGSGQQMPWLRPAFMAIKTQVVNGLQAAAAATEIQ